MIKLTEEQLNHAAFLVQQGKACEFSEPGTGKTWTATEALDTAMSADAGHRAVIVVPPIVMHQWATVLDTHGGFDERRVKVIRNGRDWFDPLRDDILVVSYHVAKVGQMHDKLREWSPTIVICDESHAMKNNGSQVTQRIIGDEGIIGNAEYVWLLTGTPIRRYPDDMYPTFRYLFPAYLKKPGSRFSLDYDQFVDKFCRTQMKKFGGMRYPRKIVTGARNEGEMRQMIDSVSVRRTLKGMKDDLPDVTQSTINVEIDDNAVLEALYEDANMRPEQHLRETDSENLLKALLEEGETALATVRRVLATEKAASMQLRGHIAELVESGPLVVFAWHREAMNTLADILPPELKIRQIHGNTAPALRGQIMQEFGRGVIDVLIGQIASMGTGLDGLQRQCHRAIFLEQDWSPAVNEQAIARLNRMGQEYPVHVDTVIADNWIDHAVYDTLRRKSAIHKELIQ